MAAEFTPTTEQVRKGWRSYRLDPGWFGRENFGRGGGVLEAEFDRWHAQELAKAKAEQREADARIASGESEHLRDAATCRDIAAAIRAASETEGNGNGE